MRTIKLYFLFLFIPIISLGQGNCSNDQTEIFIEIWQIGGTGLGLSISKNLALMMGYSVGVESNEPKGSIFYIDVKIHQETSKEVA